MGVGGVSGSLTPKGRQDGVGEAESRTPRGPRGQGSFILEPLGVARWGGRVWVCHPLGGRGVAGEGFTLGFWG